VAYDQCGEAAQGVAGAPHKSQIERRAARMPDAAGRLRHPLSLARKIGSAPGFGTVRHRWIRRKPPAHGEFLAPFFRLREQQLPAKAKVGYRPASHLPAGPTRRTCELRGFSRIAATCGPPTRLAGREENDGLPPFA
jgi:hypothetical protein